MARPSVLFYANDYVGSHVAGPGVRYVGLARALAASADVTLASPFPVDASIPGVETVHLPAAEHRRLTKLALGFDVVIAQRLPLSTALRLSASRVLVVADLYAPIVIENLVFAARAGVGPEYQRVADANAAAMRVALATADAFICAGERQRDFWLGALATAGRLDPTSYAADPELRSLLAVVPFGVEATPPARTQPVAKGVLPGIGAGDELVLWPGGIWNWLDPETVIRAVHELAGRRPALRLYFPGLRPPDAMAALPAGAGEAIALARELVAEGKTVFFNERWTPVERWGSLLTEADIAVTAHRVGIESRFAVRSRLLDAVWGRVPIVCSEGDAFSELVERRELGRVVPVGDVAGFAAAIAELLDEPRRSEVRRNLDAAAAELGWDRAVEPLLELIGARRRARRAPGRAGAAALEYAAARGRLRFGGVPGHS